MENKKLNKIKILLIISAIILILLIISLNIVKKDNTDNIEIGVTEQSVEMQNFEDVLDELPMKNITMRTKVQSFAIEYLKKVYNSLSNASNNQIQQYYEQNRNEADEFIYENSLENFKKFVSQISQMSVDKLNFEDCIFNTNTMKKLDNQYSFEIQIKYEKEDYLKYIVHLQPGDDGIIDEDEIWFESSE